MQSGLPTPPLTEDDNANDSSYTDLLKSLSIESTSDAPECSSRLERKFGDSELAFYLPSRQMGVNDMYLAFEFRAVERVMRRSRVRVAWALLRLRHPLLASMVEMHSYHDVRFVYDAPKSPDEVLLDANTALDYCALTKEDLADRYVNGPRTLSDSRLSYLTISQPRVGPSSLPTPPLSPACYSTPSYEDLPTEELYDYTIFMCAAHFIGDGMSLLDLCKTLFDILGSDKTTCQLEGQLRDEWHVKFVETTSLSHVLPVAAEGRLPTLQGKFRRAAAKVDFWRDQQKNIGGQAFPRWQSRTRQIGIRSVSFDVEKTAKILKKCKKERMSVSLVVFALCNMAWARSQPDNKHLPMMMYSALSLRPYLKPSYPLSSDLFLAVGYFNIVLPSFIPKDSNEAKLFWHRARSARDQCVRTAKSRMLPYRSREMAHKRAEQARAWAVVDDTKADSPAKPKEQPTVLADVPKTPSATLLGISLLGNLNSFCDHAKAPLFEVVGMLPGVRQRAGGMLMFSYTFAHKLYIVVNWDELGYDRDVFDEFWDGVVGGVDEFLC
ncbi:hypothetical protein OE88DRAFT_1730120 [Heliocybe sulcata]|uniref:CoA-dependent acyltransferase n=1 Tax=Heliocybe sulcata TaxID=5364 RepID=A0A5C3NH17_9AGAM|nr:hypothetical protein OE88DRAFT_1730120 [Heliocybe sulcata]